MRELIIKIDMNQNSFGESLETEGEEVVKILNKMIEKIKKDKRIRDNIEFDSEDNCVASIEVINKL